MNWPQLAFSILLYSSEQRPHSLPIFAVCNAFNAAVIYGYSTGRIRILVIDNLCVCSSINDIRVTIGPNSSGDSHVFQDDSAIVVVIESSRSICTGNRAVLNRYGFPQHIVLDE